jgi:PAS domain S-box-containing protein
VLETGQGSREEFRVMFGGAIATYDITLEPLRDGTGQIIGLTGAAFDISELARLNETLRESEERYRLLFESNPHPMWVYDTETLEFLTVNAAALKEYGYSRQEFRAMTLRDIRPAADIPALLEHLHPASDTLESSAGWRHLRKDGSLIEVEIISHPLRFAGRPARLVLAWNVTERKRAEEALRRAHDELRALVEASPQAIVSIDTAVRVLSWPGSAERMFGWTAEEVIGHPLPTIPPELADEGAELLRGTLEGRSVTEFQTTRLRKDGSRVAVSLSHAPLHDSDGTVTGAVVVYSDITERVRAEQEAHGRALAEAASRAKSQFLANMSHELRTPLNAIIGFSELLEDLTAGPLNDRQRRYVGNILTSGRHLLDLVNDILDLAKIEAGRLTLDATCFEPVTAIREVMRIVESLAMTKHLDLELVTPDALPLLTADRAKFKQVLYNLLSNAIKFTREGGRVKMRARMVPAPTAPSDVEEWLVVDVEDTGIGIRPEDHSRIFLEFEQLDASYAREQQGTGLGLALTRRLVDLHGGRIILESAEGKGSTFTVAFPPIPPSLRAEAPAREHAGVAPGDDGCPIVLIVEDDPVATELLSHYLTSHGYAVAHASNAEQALEMAQRLKPVAITLDILLPDQDGLEVLARLRALAATERIPVIVVSITDDRELGFSLGASEWLVKPVNRERFLNAVARAVPAPPKAGRQTVLVIDDHRETVDLLADTLEGRGFLALRAYGGEEGLRLAGQVLPDVIVLDLVMPDLSGFEVARRLQEQEPTRGIPILVFTFKELAAEERAALDGQVSRIVSKSDTNDLLAAIQQIPLRRRASQPVPPEDAAS